MADSNLPPSSTPPRAPAPNVLPRADGQTAQVTDVSGDLRAVPRPARLVGEVIRSDPDGRIRVKTDRGEIEMTVRGRGEIPEKGERVEVDIAPGRPPRQAVVRELPPETKPAPPRGDVPQQPTTPPRGEGPRIPVDTPPVKLEVPPVVARPAPQPLPQVPATPPRGLPPPILAPSEPLPDLPTAEAVPVKQQVAAVPLKALSGWISSLLPQKTAPATSLPALPPMAMPASVEEPLRTGDVIRLLPLPPGTEKNILSQPVAATPMVMDIGDVAVADTIIRPVTQKAAIIAANTQTANPEDLIADHSTRIVPLQAQEIKQDAGIKTILESLKPIPAAQTQNQLPLAQFQPQPQLKAVTPEFRVIKIDPPQPQAVTQNISMPSVPHMPAGAVQAKVTGFTPQNFPILSMTTPQMGAESFFALPLALPDIAEGFTLTLMPQGQGGMQSAVHPSISYTPGMAGVTPPPVALPVFADSMIWPALDDLAQAVKQADARAYQSMMQTIIPNAGNPARLPAAALLFISVVASGDIAAWMGEKTIDVLRRAGRMDAIGKLSNEMGSIRRTAQEPVSGDWRAMTLPMAWQDEIARMMLYYRHDQGPEREDGTHERITRFMFDLNLTKMGPVQIDGFHKTERLDLIVRTKTPLSIEMQQSMRRAYASALGNSRLFGELSFQNKPEQFLKLGQGHKNKSVSA